MILEVGGGEKSPSLETTINIDKKRYPATQILADCRALPFRENIFEGIIAFHVLEHLDDPEFFFIEASRVLKQRGWVHVKVPVGLNAKTDPTHLKSPIIVRKVMVQTTL